MHRQHRVSPAVRFCFGLGSTVPDPGMPSTHRLACLAIRWALAGPVAQHKCELHWHSASFGHIRPVLHLLIAHARGCCASCAVSELGLRADPGTVSTEIQPFLSVCQCASATRPKRPPVGRDRSFNVVLPAPLAANQLRRQPTVVPEQKSKLELQQRVGH